MEQKSKNNGNNYHYCMIINDLANAAAKINLSDRMSEGFKGGGWFKAAFSLADLEPDAWPLFDRLSSLAPNYDQAQSRHVWRMARRNYYQNQSTIGTVLSWAKDAGLRLEDYLTDTPDYIPKSQSSGYSCKKRPRTYEPPPLPSEIKQYTIPRQWVLDRMPDTYEQCNLANALAQVFGWERVNDTFARYFVGITHNPIAMKAATINPGSCIFPLVDYSGNVRTALFMGYDTAGHRQKDSHGNGVVTWLHYLMRKQLDQQSANKWGYGADNRPYLCLFGLHLLNNEYCKRHYPTLQGATVGVVESASTALAMSCAMPHIVWLSTMGAGNINLVADAIMRDATELAERVIIVYPDNGQYDTWSKAIKAMPINRVKVSAFMEQHAESKGEDIKDYYMRSHQQETIFIEPPTECPF